MFPEYERPEQLPDSVRREAREEDIPLLDALLRHRLREERRAARELLRQRAAAAASAGSQGGQAGKRLRRDRRNAAGRVELKITTKGEKENGDQYTGICGKADG